MKKQLLVILAFIIMGSAFGQLTGTKTIGASGDFTSFVNAIAALNTSGVGSGGVTFNISAAYAETITAPLLITATGTSGNPIVFQKTGSGANPVITRTDGGSNNTSTLGGQGDGIIILQGTDYITFDGIDVTATTVETTTTGIEYGYYLRKASVTDACKNVTIKNCTITMAKGTTAAYVAGIYISNNDASSLVSSATGITVTSTGGRSENITITGNTIKNTFSGILARGYNHSSSPYDFQDQNLVVGAVGAGNTIQNYAGTGLASSAYAVYLIYQTSPTVSYNTIDNAGGGGSNAASTLYGIFFSSSNAGGNTVFNNNTITLGQGATSAAHCIYISPGCTSLTVNNNSFNYGTFASTTTSYFIYNSNATNNITVRNNSCGTITKSGAGQLEGYYDFGSPTGGTAIIRKNNFSNITLTGASAFYGIRHYTATSQIINMDSNTVSNITGGTGLMYGLYQGYGAAGSTVNGNTVSNISLTSSSTNAIYGIYFGASTAPLGLEVKGNSISQLTNAGTGAIYGLYNVLGTANSILKNKIFNLSSSNASGLVFGIYFAGGTLANVYNNYISDLRATAATGANAISGIYITGGTTVNLYYNTVYMNATGGATFGSSGVYKSSTVTSEFRNNVIVNVSTPGATSGNTVAVRWSGVYNSTYYTSTSDRNCFYAGTPASNKLIYYDGTNSDQTLAAYKTRVSTRDAYSVTENPPFMNVATTPYNLKINTAVATQLESWGTNVTSPLITDDYEGDIRYGNPGYTIIAGKAPDIGADEFEGKQNDLTPPIVTYAPLLPTSSFGPRTLTATISDLTGSGIVHSGSKLPMIYYKVNSGSYSGAQGSWVSGNTFTFPINATVVSGDVVSYYVVAQDTVGNVTCNPSTGASGLTSNPPAAGTPPTTPNTYSFIGCISGTKTVGATGADYTTLTQAFAALNANELCGPVTLSLLDASYTTGETFPLTLNANNGSSATNTITIKPTQANTVITGTVASSFLIKIIASYTTIDGSITAGGTSRDLTITNNSTTSPTVLWFASSGYLPVTNTTLKNCIIVNGVNTSSTAEMMISDGTTYSNPGYFNNITIQNNSFQKAYYGIFCNANVVTGNGSGLLITGNDMNSAANPIINTAVYIQGVDGATVTNNNIGNMVSSAAGSVRGIWFATGTNSGTISGNNINTLTLTNTGGYTINGIYVSSGSGVTGINVTNNTVTNLANSGTLQLLAGIATQTPNTNVNGNTVSNITQNAAYTFWGIIQSGALNSTLNNNTVSNLTSTAQVPYGLNVQGTSSGVTISGNIVNGLTTSYGATTLGLAVFGAGTNMTITKNKIYNIKNTNATGYSVAGLYLASTSSTANISAYNNIVYDVAGYGAASTTGSNGYGIMINTGGGYNLWHNSLSLNTNQTLATGLPACLLINSGVTALDIRNNIFSIGATTGTNRYCVISNVDNTAYTSLDYNDYYTSGTNMGYYAAANVLDLAAWKTALGKDAHSKSVNPLFVSATDLTATVNDLYQAGVNIPTVATDYNGAARNNPPDIGAINIPLCTGAVGGVAVVTGSTALCGSGTPVITANSYSTGAAGGYQWQHSSDNFSSDIQNYTGQTNPASLTLPGAITSTTYIRLKVTCAFGTTEAYSNVLTFTINPIPTSTISPVGPVTLCSPATQLLTGGTNAALPTYQWKKDGTIISGATDATYTASTTGNYTLVATETSTTCSATSTAVSVTINPQPTALTITPTPASTNVASGGILKLDATGGLVGGSGTVTIGSATTQTNPATEPTAFCNRWKQYWCQMVFTAAELQAAGVMAGPITSITFTITSLGDGTNVTNFSVYLGPVATSTLSTFTTTGLTLVYGPSTYNHAIGANTITFTTPYNWDGTSNILVDLRQNGADQTNNAITYYTGTAGYTVVYARTSTAPPPDYWTTNPTPTTSLNRLNIVFGCTVPSPAPVTWTPNRFLYTNAGATVVYTGGNTRTIYTKPDSSLTYTATATVAATGCSRTQTVTVSSCPATPGSPNATNVTVSSFDINWTSTQGSHVTPLTYTVEVATENTFTPPIVGTYTTTNPTVTKSITGLTANTKYYYRIKAAGECESAWTTTGFAITCPAAPAMPTSSAIGSTGFTVNWTAPTGGTGSSLTYTLEVADNAAFTGSTEYTGITDLFKVLTGLTENTQYWFKVKAVGSCTGDFSAAGNEKTCAGVPQSPSTASVTSNSFTINWTAPAGGSASSLIYTVDVATDAGFTSIVHTYTTSDLSQAVAGLTPNTQYHYRIKAGGSCSGSYASGQEITCPAAPGTPTSSAIGSTGFTVNWIAPTGGTGSSLTYTLAVADNDAFTGSTEYSGITDLFKVLTGLTENTQYWFKVKAVGSCSGNFSAAGNEKTCAGAPQSPSTASVTKNSFTINWTAPAGGSASSLTYTVDVATDAGFTSIVHTYTTSGLSQAVAGLTPNTQYYYRIKANGSCSGSYTTGQETTCPDTPAMPTASGIGSASFTMNYTAPTGGSAVTLTYLCEVAKDAAFTSGYQSYTASGLSHTFTGLDPNTIYHFRVSAVGNCTGVASTANTFTTCPAAPVAGTPVYSSSTATINWSSASGGGGTGITYTIEVSISSNFVVGNLPGSPFTVLDPTTSLNLTGLIPNTRYYYHIKSTGTGTCASSWSTLASFITCPGIPENLGANNIASTSFDLAWTASSGGSVSAIHYVVDVTTDAGFASPITGSPFTVNHPTVSLHVSGLTGNTHYYFRVKSVGNCSSDYATGDVTTLACFEPEALTAIPTSGNTAYITWSAPVIAPIGGYSYEIRTYPGNVLLQEDTITDNLFVSISGLTPGASYTAKLRSVCDGGTSSQWVTTNFTTTNCTVATIPYSENFESYTPPQYGCLTVEDVNQDEIKWYTASGSAHGGTKKMTILRSFTNSMNDWFYTKGLALESGRRYKVSFWYRSSTTSNYESMEVKFGYGPMASLITSSVIWSNAAFNNTAYAQATGIFTAPATGTFWVGWHCFSAANKSGISVDDIYICELPDIAPSITGPTVVCKPQSSITYSANIADAASYSWTVPSGASITGATNTNTITVSFPAGSQSGNVTVYGINDCGTGLTTTLPVDVYPQLPAGISVSGTASTVCEGESITFTATPTNGGTTPAYQWKKKGSAISGATGATYTYVPEDGDAITCVLTSNYICATGNPVESNSLSITVIPQLRVGSIRAAQTICATTAPVQLNGVAPSTGVVKSYQWEESTDNVSFSPISGATNLNYQPGTLTTTTYYRQSQNATVTCGGPLYTNTVTITVIPLSPVSVSIASSDNNRCDGVSISFTATPTNGGDSPSYQWKKNGSDISGATDYTYSYVPVNGDKITCVLTSNKVCPSGNPATSNEISMLVKPLKPVSVSINRSDNYICDGTEVTYTATPTNGGAAPAYQWKKNGTDIEGATASTYAYVPSDGDIITCLLTSNQECAIDNPALSDEIMMVVYPNLPVSVSITVSENGICDGITVTYTATPTNGGISPDWRWKINGNSVSGATNSTYSYAPANGDVVTCVLTSSEMCTSGNHAPSNPITMVVHPLLNVSVNISADHTEVCDGSSVTLTAVPTNGGTTPLYQWEKNNLPVSGATEATYSYAPANGDIIKCVLTSNAVCPVGTPAISNPVALTVHPILPISIRITTPSDTVCAGSLITFTAIPTNAGVTPAYQWRKGGNDITGATNSTYTYVPSMNDVISCQISSNENCRTGNSSVSNDITITVLPVYYVSIGINSTATSVCEGTSVNFTSMIFNGGTSPVYQWKIGGQPVSGATNSSYSYVPQNGDAVTCMVTSSHTCTLNNPATSVPVTMTVTPILPVSIGISASANNVCEGTSVTFTATPTNGGTPSYQWKKNSVDVTGATAATYTYGVSNGDVISCQLVSSLACKSGSPALSNEITMVTNPNLPVTVSIVRDASVVCAGTTVNFTATATNGGTTPVYQWKVNGLNNGTNSNQFSYIPSNNENVTCVVTSSETCTSGNPATSNSLVMTVNPVYPVSVSNAASTNNVCQGTSIKFTATGTNGGATPQYQWKKNGNPISGATASTYTYAPANGDVVTCLYTSSILCTTNNPATSNPVTAVIIPSAPVSVAIAASANPACGTNPSVTFTATPTNGGTSPAYQWKVNGVRKVTTVTYTYTPLNGDLVTCTLTSNAQCATGSPATSSTITMSVLPNLPAAVSISTPSTSVCSGNQVTFTATPTNGGLTPLYQWTVNSVVITGATNSTYTYEPADNDQVRCVMTSSYGCPTGNPATSNPITMTVNQTLHLGVTISTPVTDLCQGGQVTLTANAVDAGTSPAYQWWVNGNAISGATASTYSYIPENQDHVHCVVTSNAPCTVGSPATSNTITFTVRPYLSVIIDASATSICSGTTVTYTATPTNGGPSLTYQWLVNNFDVPGATNQSYSYEPDNNDEITCMVYSSSACPTGNPATSNVIKMSVTQSLYLGVTISTPLTTVCEGTSATLTAITVDAGPSPSFQWWRNGSSVSGATGTSYTYTPANGDNVYCVVTSGAPCTYGSPATSNHISFTVKPYLPVSLYIEPSANPVCSGNQVTFTAFGENPGTTPLYQWYLNGNLVPGVSGSTYSLYPNSFDEVYCVLTSSEMCTTDNPATAETVVLNVFPTQTLSISITSTATEVCSGTHVTFTATATTGGYPPIYQWRKNNVDITGANTSTYSYAPANGDVITCKLISANPCAIGSPAISNAIAMTVNPSFLVSVTIVASSNPVNEGSPVTFTATAVNGGTLPVYQWYVNSVEVGSNSTTYTYNPRDNDAVYCIVTSNIACPLGNPATSNIVTVKIKSENVTVNDVTVHNGETKCYNAIKNITVAATGNFLVENGGSATMIAGENIIYLPGTKVEHGGYLHGYISDDFCGSAPPGIVSAITGKDELPVVVEKAEYRIYPNPTSGNFTLEVKGDVNVDNIRVEIYNLHGERVLSGDLIGEKKHEFVFGQVPVGIYFVKIISGADVETIKLVRSR